MKRKRGRTAKPPPSADWHYITAKLIVLLREQGCRVEMNQLCALWEQRFGSCLEMDVEGLARGVKAGLVPGVLARGERFVRGRDIATAASPSPVKRRKKAVLASAASPAKKRKAAPASKAREPAPAAGAGVASNALSKQGPAAYFGSGSPAPPAAATPAPAAAPSPSARHGGGGSARPAAVAAAAAADRHALRCNGGSAVVLGTLSAATSGTADILRCLNNTAFRHYSLHVSISAVVDDNGHLSLLLAGFDAAGHRDAHGDNIPDVVAYDLQLLCPCGDGDGHKAALADLARILHPLLEDPAIVKMVHDVAPVAMAIAKTLGLRLAGAFDVELAYELLRGRAFADLAVIVRYLHGGDGSMGGGNKWRRGSSGSCGSSSGRAAESGRADRNGARKGSSGGSGGGGGGGGGSGGGGGGGGGGTSNRGTIWQRRLPVVLDMVQDCAVDTYSLIEARARLEAALPGPAWEVVARASQARADYSATRLQKLGSYRRMTLPSADYGATDFGGFGNGNRRSSHWANAANADAAGGRGVLFPEASRASRLLGAVLSETEGADLVSYELWWSVCDALQRLGAGSRGYHGGGGGGSSGSRRGGGDVPAAAFLADGPRVQGDGAMLLQLLPDDYRQSAAASSTDSATLLTEIQLNVGMAAVAIFGRERVFLANGGQRKVTLGEVKEAAAPLLGRFGPDNRAALEGELHRISAMRDKSGEIYGLTMRVGRYVHGVANIVHDVLFSLRGAGGARASKADAWQLLPSVLVLGPPGAGKTTVIREISRQLANKYNTVIVDTSNEICGDGMAPHEPSTGLARRIMVPEDKSQHSVMLEAVKNHTPDVVVIDEISQKQEAQACRDIKERGVRLVASAHGDFQSLVANPELNTLVGGKKQVIIGDALASVGDGSKLRTERAGAPVFDVIVELSRGEDAEWRLIRDVAAAVDGILGNAKSEADGGVGERCYHLERRRRRPAAGGGGGGGSGSNSGGGCGHLPGGSNGSWDALAGDGGPFFLLRHEVVEPPPASLS